MTRIGPTRTRILLSIIQGHIDGLPPSWRNLCFVTGVTYPAVQQHLAALSKAGLIDWSDGLARTVVPKCRFYRMDLT